MPCQRSWTGAAGRAGDQAAADPLNGIMAILADVVDAARDGCLDTMAALSSLAAACRLAAGMEPSEVALIEAARDRGATWGQIAAAMVSVSGRPRRNAMLTSPAASSVHQAWTRRRDADTVPWPRSPGSQPDRGPALPGRTRAFCPAGWLMG